MEDLRQLLRKKYLGHACDLLRLAARVAEQVTGVEVGGHAESDELSSSQVVFSHD